MTYLSSRVQTRLQEAFAENKMNISIRSDHIIVEDSYECTKERIREIIESAGFCPLISENRCTNDILFTVTPYKIPDFFNQEFLLDSIDSKSSIEKAALVSKVVKEKSDIHFTKNEIVNLLKSKKFISLKKKEAKDKWIDVNVFRTLVSPALNKGLCEIIQQCAANNGPIIEIGSGIGYFFSDYLSSKNIRTQPDREECQLLIQSTSDPVYKIDIEGIYNSLLSSERKVPLFFALNVFDTLSSDIRKASFRQLSQLQSTDDRILIMLDTNPGFNRTVEALEFLYPGHAMLPYFPLTHDPAKFSVIVVPLEYLACKPSLDDLLSMIKQDSMLIGSGIVSQRQHSLHQLQKKLGLKVISLEDFFVAQVKKELMQVGYEVDSYYHNSFISGDLSQGSSEQTFSEIKQELIYKSVTDTLTVRQWDLKDKNLLNSLSSKGLSLPNHFNEEFLTSLREKKQKIFGAEILVVNARKV